MMKLTITEPGPWNFTNPECRGMDTELFFAPSHHAYEPAVLAACMRCKHRVECAEYALADPGIEGLWGGLTPEQRRNIRRIRSDARAQAALQRQSR